MTEAFAIVLVLMIGNFSTAVLSILIYCFMAWRAKRRRHAASVEWPDGLFYFGISITWLIAVGVAIFVYP